MAQFGPAYVIGEHNEGGYSNNPHDKGGETYKGISRNNWPKWEGWALIDNYNHLQQGVHIQNVLLDEKVKAFYLKNFWQVMRGDEIVNQHVANYLYDFYINAGSNAIKVLQRVLGIVADGVIGKQTIAAINAKADLLQAFHKARVEYYLQLATELPDNRRFLKGWLNRANALADMV